MAMDSPGVETPHGQTKQPILPEAVDLRVKGWPVDSIANRLTRESLEVEEEIRAYLDRYSASIGRFELEAVVSLQLLRLECSLSEIPDNADWGKRQEATMKIVDRTMKILGKKKVRTQLPLTLPSDSELLAEEPIVPISENLKESKIAAPKTALELFRKG